MKTSGVIVNCLDRRIIFGSITVVNEGFTSYIETLVTYDEKQSIKYKYCYDETNLNIVKYLPSRGVLLFKPKGLELCNEMNIKSKRGRIIMDHDGYIKYLQAFRCSRLNEIDGIIEAAHCRASNFFDEWLYEIESVTLIEEYK